MYMCRLFRVDDISARASDIRLVGSQCITLHLPRTEFNGIANGRSESNKISRSKSKSGSESVSFSDTNESLKRTKFCR